MIYSDGFASGELQVVFNEDDTGYVKQYASHLYLDYKSGLESQQYKFTFFLGPNHYQTLKGLDRDMEELVQLSANFFLFKWVKYINRWVIIPLFNFFEGYVSSYGIIILLMTLLIKIALSPLTFKSYKSQAMLKVLKPELDELKEKYKDDQQKFGTEQWKLYQKAGVSPFSGCVPMLLQFPILIAMFYFFPGSIELRGESFLWAKDLSTYDDLISFSATIPLIGNHISLFTVLMTITSLITALTNSQMNQAGAQGALKYMPYFFPIVLFFVFNNFPAALTYYYFLSNVISIGQQYAIKAFFIDEDKLHQQIQKNKAKPRKKGGFAARLEEAYKEQQRRSNDSQNQKGNRQTRRKK
jgi:YidC/Oxa1 family membrane protein insertase